ncbi:YveK family protein [Mangrovibacillus cuniculi]|uniref:Capsular biosynthesis protein n=1 Tax=Mangrovibacillus cuniculi TaxID=2593652 RepID=A0A7S8HG94_9BACI|nr:Wzz/FepE/Etk N-terminal domain-containing protein [Mangrovibacillus cuniculi]QPC47663.1 capsular biosynthesis protein [Mangrovibacillus cuniculi]
MEETISLKELFQTLKKRMWMISSITLIAAITSGVISFYFLTPVYSSTAQILVNKTGNNEPPALNTSEIQMNIQLINTYNDIIKSPLILKMVRANLDLDRTANTLMGQMSVSSNNNSQLVRLTVEDTDPYMAKDIANMTAKVFQDEIDDLMGLDNVTILAQAEVGENPSPIKPKPLLNIAIAIVVGLMAGVGLAFLLEYLDNTVKNEHDVERVLGLPVIGSITIIEQEEVKKASRSRRNQVKEEKGGSISV